MIANIRDQLSRDEGSSLEAYFDTEGWATVGIGHWLGVKSLSEVPANLLLISQAEELALFNADLAHVNSLLSVYFPWWDQLSTARAGVLQNMGFNLGVQGLIPFKAFMAWMKARNWSAAASDLLTTKVAKQLPERYHRLHQQILTGHWQ